jgi:hypothetical protein
MNIKVSGASGCDQWKLTVAKLDTDTPDLLWVLLEDSSVCSSAMGTFPVSDVLEAICEAMGMPLPPLSVSESVDMVNSPPHYQSTTGIECIEAIRAALGEEGFKAYCRGNAIKYIWREKADSIEDRKKAIWYLKRANGES